MKLTNLIWKSCPKNYKEWTDILKINDVYKTVSNFLYSKKYQHLFKDVCDVIAYQNFQNFKSEFRAKKYLEKIGYTVTKSTVLLDSMFYVDLLAEKEATRLAIQVKKAKHNDLNLNKLISWSYKNKYKPVLLIVYPNKIIWKNL